MTAQPNAENMLARDLNYAVEAVLSSVPDYQHNDEDEYAECGRCGYAEYACICDLLCDYRDVPAGPTCDEVREDPKAEYCDRCEEKARLTYGCDDQYEAGF